MKDELRRILIDDPSQVKPEDFSYGLLNSIFIAHHGLGTGKQTMEIGGVIFTKEVTGPFFSNSRKNRDFSVEIYGKGYSYYSDSKHAGNKLNSRKIP